MSVNSHNPIISVIIAAKGECKHLIACVESILANDFDSFDIIVADDGINTSVLEKLETYSVRVLKNPSSGPSSARNYAVNNTDAVLVAFIDDDCIAEKKWLSELYRGLLESMDSAACGGRQLLPSDSCEFSKRVFRFLKKAAFISDYVKNNKSNAVYEVEHNASCNVLYRKECFENVGGFLENLWPGEDLELDYKLRKNYKLLLYNPQAIVYHYRPETIKKFSRMMTRYGWAQGFLVKEYGPFRALHFMPLLLLMLSAIALACVFLEPKLLLALMVLGELFLFAYCSGDLILNYMFFLALIKWNLGFIKGYFKV